MAWSTDQIEQTTAALEPTFALAGFVGWSYKTYIGCLFLAALTALVVTPWVIRLATSLGAVDEPGHRKSHGRPVPLLGGLAIFVAMWVPLLSLLVLDNLVTQRLWNQSSHVMTLFAAGVVMLILGAIDDLKGIRARYKLLVQIPVALGVWLAGVRFDRLDLPFFGELDANLLGPLVSIIWLIGITNAFNLIDGIDGLAAGVALFVALTNGLIAVWTDSAILAVLMFSIAGACLGFLKYNFNPARVFLGDAGSLFLGMTLGITSVLTSSKSQVASSFLIAVVVLGYPALDTLLAMAQRILRGKSPFAGDASHIHHRLLRKGISQRRSVFALYAVCVLFCVAAIGIVVRKNALTAFVFLVIGAVTGYGLWALGYLKMFARPSLRKDRHVYRAHYHFVEMVKAKMCLAKTRREVLALLGTLPGELGFERVKILLAGQEGEPRLEDNYESAGGGVLAAGQRVVSGAVHRDNYKYPESGLEVEAQIRDNDEYHDLVIERRALLADALETANRRLIELRAELGQDYSGSPKTAT